MKRFDARCKRGGGESMAVGHRHRAEALRRGMPQLATVLHHFTASRMMRDSL